MNIFIIIILAIAAIESTVLIILWNRARANDKSKALNKKIKEQEKQRLIKYFIHQLELAETLTDIYTLHIKIWANGIQHKNFGPDRYGMFKAKDILTMNKEEVYLGNIWGLFTEPLPFWENQDDKTKKLVIDQYRNHLLSNLKMLLWKDSASL